MRRLEGPATRSLCSGYEVQNAKYNEKGYT